MADKKISALNASTTPLAGSEVLPIVQGGSTVKVSVANLTAGRSVSASALGVGVTNTSNNIHVDIPFGGASNPVMLQNSAATVDGRGSDIVFRSSGTDYAVIRGLTQTDSTSGRLFFYTASSGALNLQMSLDKFGDVTANTGNFVVGTANKGIDFSANTHAAGMTSELLTWYEEGVWTPTVGANLTVVGSFSSSARYTRIGRQVTVIGTLVGSTSVSVVAGGVMCGGLPFTVSGFGLGNLAVSGAGTVGEVLVTTTNVISQTAIGPVSEIYFSATYFV